MIVAEGVDGYSREEGLKNRARAFDVTLEKEWWYSLLYDPAIQLVFCTNILFGSIQFSEFRL